MKAGSLQREGGPGGNAGCNGGVPAVGADSARHARGACRQLSHHSPPAHQPAVHTSWMRPCPAPCRRVLISLQRAPYEREPPLVTFRSMAAQVRYIWPIQQPVTDFGAQRERLKAVRQQLGWRLLGCDLLECYEE